MNDVTAILLCGGKGQRLKPFTDKLPKPLIPLRGKPLLLHLMEALHGRGIRRFVLCTGHQAEAIERFVENDCPKEWSVTCSNSGDASMTDRILDARRLAPGRALVCYGDTLANVDLKSLATTHEKAGTKATLTVHPLVCPFGVVEIDVEDRVSTFAEKPTLPYWINIGFLLCEPAALDRLRRGQDMITFLSALARDGQLSVYRHTGKHLTVNTEKERMEAEEQIHLFNVAQDE